MGHIITDLKELFRRGDISVRLIFINVSVFIAAELVKILFLLFNRSVTPVFDLLALPASFTHFLYQPWSVVTYMFMHGGVMHVLFNMLWLYWFGRLFLMFFSSRHLRGVYLLGGLAGGLLYMLAYNVFPYFSSTVHYAMLVGASASVLAIVAAVAYREPNYPIQLLLVGTVRLKYLALFVVITDLLFITSSNAGGHIAHLGGVLAGLGFAAALRKGADLTAWINRCIDVVGSLPQLGSRKRKPRMKVHYGGRADRMKDYDYNARKKDREDRINRILEKIKKSGYDSLTKEEKEDLFNASRE